MKTDKIEMAQSFNSFKIQVNKQNSHVTITIEACFKQCTEKPKNIFKKIQ